MSYSASALDAELSRAAEAIVSVPRDATVLLACHVNPDGDALGTMLGFGLGLRRLGFTDIYATFPEPYEVAEPFRFLPGLDLLVEPDKAPGAPDLAVSFDAASPGRLGELIPALQAAPTWIMLDHHRTNTGFGGVRLVDPDAAATAVVAMDLLDRLEVDLDPEIATCLYVAIATDTGSYKFDATTPDVFSLASRLVQAGANPADVARRVFDTRPFPVIQLLADVLKRAELDKSAVGGLGLITAYATSDDLERYGQPGHVLESFIEVVRTAAEADVACLVKPAAAGRWSVSLRSKGGTDVSAVAFALGGGGHRLAAGFVGEGELADVFAAVRDQLDRR